jgi:hypothetical protein
MLQHISQISPASQSIISFFCIFIFCVCCRIYDMQAYLHIHIHHKPDQKSSNKDCRRKVSPFQHKKTSPVRKIFYFHFFLNHTCITFPHSLTFFVMRLEREKRGEEVSIIVACSKHKKFFPSL